MTRTRELPVASLRAVNEYTKLPCHKTNEKARPPVRLHGNIGIHNGMSPCPNPDTNAFLLASPGSGITSHKRVQTRRK
jgi:hypothetical protein